MKISIGADHAGYALKEAVRRGLEAAGHEVTDHGTSSPDSTDYPDYAVQVGEDVQQGKAERGILVCSTGVGMSIAANKLHGIRAANVWNADEATLSRQHNNANVLALGARYTNAEQAAELVDIFLNTPFEGGRHARRVAKIAAAEQRDKPKESIEGEAK
ncbi:MAG: ribose 5-phosphate isomerase B [Acidobacteria bacterium]|nr:ribose 5-phosphate isomerase B [Acidobacteriota bacterium]